MNVHPATTDQVVPKLLRFVLRQDAALHLLWDSPGQLRFEVMALAKVALDQFAHGDRQAGMNQRGRRFDDDANAVGVW
jgi:hypothetical protein